VAIESRIRKSNHFIKMINLTFEAELINFLSTLYHFKGERSDEKTIGSDCCDFDEFCLCLYV
jgi:hypothetical protein